MKIKKAPFMEAIFVGSIQLGLAQSYTEKNQKTV